MIGDEGGSSRVVDRDPPAGIRVQERLVIRVERVTLPDGLRSIAHRDPGGNLIIYVSDSLDAECARAAVRKAIRASRRPAWRAGLPPAGVALLVALRQWPRGAVTIPVPIGGGSPGGRITILGIRVCA